MALSATTICLIACHGGPADHFATFAEHLSKDATIEIHASGQALNKFQERNIEVKYPFSLNQISFEEEDILAEKIVRACSVASVVITDVGHKFDVKIQDALSQHAPNVLRLAYYDNPEPYVPGGYSAVAAKVMLAAHRILFANSNLTMTSIFQELGKEVDFGDRKKVGIGYYPINQAEKIAQRRKAEHLSLRQKLFSNNDLVDNGQKVLVYFGGNNEEYFTEAFPAFLKLLEKGIEQSDFSNLVIVIQQHPGAKSKNLDGKMVSDWMSMQIETSKVPRIIISNFTSDEAQIVAEGALYHQTSMGPQLVLAGIPTVQIGHETFQDVLVRNQLSPSVINVVEFINVIDGLTHHKKKIPREIILKGLGFKEDWQENLVQAMKI